MEFKHTNQCIIDFCEAYTKEWKDLISKEYINSPLENMTYNITTGKNQYRITINVVDYFYYWNYGRGPGKMPPLQPIEHWIKKYNIIPKPLTLKSGKTVIPSQKSLAFLIARSIGLKGTKGRRLWDDFHNKFVKIWKKKINEAVERDIAELVEKELE